MTRLLPARTRGSAGLDPGRRGPAPSRGVTSVLLLAALLGTSGCASIPHVEASGSISGYAIRGPVDSPVARDYLEGRTLPPRLQAAREDYLAAGAVPSREALAQLSQQYSPDVATLFFLETLSARPEIRDLRERYERELAFVRRVGVARARPQVPNDLLILLVPGWFYLANGAITNADYRIQRSILQRWGVAHALVPVLENGAVEENARIVAEAIRRTSHGRKLLVVSASKSGAEVALALGRELEPPETSSVVGWLSIVGVMRGSPLADRVLEPDMCWLTMLMLGFDGYDLEGARSMQTARARKAFQSLRIPAHVRTLSLMGVPLSGHITSRGSFGYGQIREFGPNDGLTLLADQMMPRALPILAPGLDHFLGPEQDVISTAIFRVFAADLQKSAPPTLQPPPAPSAPGVSREARHSYR